MADAARQLDELLAAATGLDGLIVDAAARAEGRRLARYAAAGRDDNTTEDSQR